MAAFAAVLAVSSACGSSSTMPAAPGTDFAGRWQGVIEVPVFAPDDSEILFWEQATLTLQLSQDGVDVGGPMSLALGGGLDLPGTWSGLLNATAAPTTLTFAARYQAEDPSGAKCEGTLTGTLNVTTHDMQGAFNGNNCVRTYVGNLRASKQQ
jgi:hypothetical protein